jgi:shikimate dehydrogenase
MLADALGVSVSYKAIDVTPDRLAEFVRNSRAEFDGYNVTMPHKETIIPLLDALAVSAGECGAVNAVRNTGRKLEGHSTDGYGVLRSLKPVLGEITGKRVVIIGAGGAAKAAATALVKAGAKVTVVSRRKIGLPGTDAVYFGQLNEACKEAEVIINATPLGMAGKEEFTDFEFLSGTAAVVFEFIYKPRETQLLCEARVRGMETVEGISLLIWQAAEAFRIFTGAEVSDEVVLKICKKFETFV